MQLAECDGCCLCFVVSGGTSHFYQLLCDDGDKGIARLPGQRLHLFVGGRDGRAIIDLKTEKPRSQGINEIFQPVGRLDTERPAQ
jgi:hypothetical protein